jgi:K+-transporting ATPase ATPase C chain
MKNHVITSVLMTIVLTVLVGIAYPLIVTGIAQVGWKDKADGQLIYDNGALIGSRIIGQPFTGPGYFHSRPSAAGAAGYDAANSAASNFGPTNQKLIDRVKTDTARLQAESATQGQVPIDMVTSSASGLDPHITPAAAEFQVARVARERGLSEVTVRELVRKHTIGREFGGLGETRVNVLELNLSLRAINEK